MDRNEKIWAYTSKGITAHAFIAPWIDKNGEESADYRRAVCRGGIVHHVGLTRSVKDAAINVCFTCEMKLAAFEKEAAALHDQAVAAMRDEIAPEFPAEALEMHAVREAGIRSSDAAPEFPAGTRVVTHTGLTGTVMQIGRGVCKIPNTRKYGQHYVSIKLDPRPEVSTLLPRRAWYVSELTNLDALHVEALETDGLETAMVAAGEPQRFHYRAVLATTGGTPLDGIEGYINASDRDAAGAALQERYQTDLIRLTSLHINLA